MDVAGDGDTVFEADELGSVVPFEDTVTLASGLGDPSHGNGVWLAPPGHADAATFTCNVNVSVPLYANPVFGEGAHENDDAPTVPSHVPPAATVTPAGSDPVTE
jgi:hypothetical protein